MEAIFEIGKRSDIKNSHHTGFTRQSIERLFRDEGFVQTEIVTFGVGRCPDVKRLDNRPGVSIFFEAVK